MLELKSEALTMSREPKENKRIDLFQFNGKFLDTLSILMREHSHRHDSLKILSIVLIIYGLTFYPLYF